MSDFHKSVLLTEVLKGLRVERNEKYIDATLGGGGHSFEILKLGGIVLGIDVDKDAIAYVKSKKLCPPPPNVASMYFSFFSTLNPAIVSFKSTDL